jgi:peptide chain release factor
MEIQISSGQGPAECELAVEKLAAALVKEFKDTKILSQSAGIKGSRSIKLSSKADLSFLDGTVLWICVSPYRPHHKRKNWFVDVSICGKAEAAEFDESLVRIETFHCGGNGGQNVNKVETGVRAIYLPLGLSSKSTEERSQHQNRRIAMSRLKDMVKARNANSAASVKSDDWLEHTRIQRGNPVRVYEGMGFKLREGD